MPQPQRTKTSLDPAAENCSISIRFYATCSEPIARTTDIFTSLMPHLITFLTAAQTSRRSTKHTARCRNTTNVFPQSQRLPGTKLNNIFQPAVSECDSPVAAKPMHQLPFILVGLSEQVVTSRLFSDFRFQKRKKKKTEREREEGGGKRGKESHHIIVTFSPPGSPGTTGGRG